MPNTATNATKTKRLLVQLLQPEIIIVTFYNVTFYNSAFWRSSHEKLTAEVTEQASNHARSQRPETPPTSLGHW